MKIALSCLALPFAAVLTFSPLAQAQSGPSQSLEAGQRMADLIRGFSTREREQIRDYYHHAETDEGDAEEKEERGKKHKEKGGKQGKHKEKALPKGLQKKLARGGSLPPGWQRKLEKGEVLDPEVRAAGEPLPRELTDVLDPTDEVTEIIRIQDKVVRVTRGEGTVVDIIDLVDIAGGVLNQ